MWRDKAFTRAIRHTSYTTYTFHLTRARKYAFIAHPPRKPFAVEPLEQRHHDAPRTMQRFAKLADGRRTIARDELRNRIPHFGERRARKNHVIANLDHFLSLDQELQRLLCCRLGRELLTRRRVERRRRDMFAYRISLRLDIGRQLRAM